MSQIKNRSLITRNSEYNYSIFLLENNKKLCELQYMNSPTSNCQVCTLLNADAFYKMDNNLIIECFTKVRISTGKKLILISISNKHSYNKLIKLFRNVKKNEFKIISDNEFINIKNKKSNQLLIQKL